MTKPACLQNSRSKTPCSLVGLVSSDTLSGINRLSVSTMWSKTTGQSSSFYLGYFDQIGYNISFDFVQSMHLGQTFESLCVFCMLLQPAQSAGAFLFIAMPPQTPGHLSNCGEGPSQVFTPLKKYLLICFLLLSISSNMAIKPIFTEVYIM